MTLNFAQREETHYKEIYLEELLGPLNDTEKKGAPPKVWIAGNHELFDQGPRVAIVGSRKMTTQGMTDAKNIVRSLVRHKIIIVSGLAEGIDTVAHETAIQEGKNTIAVLGTPITKCYPEKNYMLQSQIMRDHLAISQFPPNHRTQPKDFILRNRTMALISHASIIIEAGETSGSLSQGWEALRLCRPLFILKSVTENPLLTWPKKMCEYGARVLSSYDEVLEFIPQNIGMDIDVALSP